MLEMLLVVGIMSALALSATLFVGNQDDQQRFEETNQRLQAIRRAVVGDETMPAGQYVPEGFVAENGVLPGALNQLLSKPLDWTDQIASFPVFDTTPDANGFNDDTGISLADSTAALAKGFSSGYVLALAGAGNTFGDAWRKVGSDSNFGWQVTASTSSISVSSLGKNGIVETGPVTDKYDIEVTDTIAATQWSSLVAGLSFTLVRSGATPFYRDIDGNASTFDPSNLRLALLVFRNSSNAINRWQRFTSETVPSCVDNDASTPFDHDNDDTNNNGITDTSEGSASEIDATPPHFCPSSITFKFPTVSFASPYDRIPMGKHLLVLLEDTDQVIGNNETLFEWDDNNDGDETLHLPITCRPSGCPHATLILR